jgi:hypothetical protein
MKPSTLIKHNNDISRVIELERLRLVNSKEIRKVKMRINNRIAYDVKVKQAQNLQSK